MDVSLLLLILALAGYVFQVRDERRRVGLLATYLGHYQIEQLMATLTEGYMRALGETDAARQQQIWSMLGSAETALSEQFQKFVADFARVDEAAARVSKLPISIFYTGKWWPNSTFDLRKALGMQHTCHWYCKSLGVASARLVMRHQTPYQKVLDSVAPDTRQAYTALIAR